MFPIYRPRRLRANPTIRRLVRETRLSIDNLVYPMFVSEEENKREIASMPGIYQLSIDNAVAEAKDVEAIGIPAILLFGIPNKKDEAASEAYAENGIIQKAVKAIKDSTTELLVITDVCLCEYTSHGHCGIIKNEQVDNDLTLELLAKSALSHVEAGADIVAPSDMMDGRIAAIRSTLDEEGYYQIPIISYAAKYASAFYGPFREAAESTPQFGDRRSYQMDPPNIREAVREVELDINEGADIVMVKPALAYLDVIKTIKEEFDHPVAAYNVSGEFSMVKAAAQNGWIDEKNIILEIAGAIKRAGADIIITYHAKDLAKWLR